jgi:hypothetical protein
MKGQGEERHTKARAKGKDEIQGGGDRNLSEREKKPGRSGFLAGLVTVVARLHLLSGFRLMRSAL